MSACKNPECRNGLTPGVIIVGKGNAKMPVLGQTQRWGWVRCLSCSENPDDSKAGARYKHVNRTPEDIAHRAELATSKAPYKPPSAVAKAFGGLRVPGGAPVPVATSSSTLDNERLTKLLEQVSQLNNTIMKLTNQVGDLLEENRALRKRLDGAPVTQLVAPQTN